MKLQALPLILLCLVLGLCATQQAHAQMPLQNSEHTFENMPRLEQVPGEDALKGQSNVYNVKKVGGAVCNGIADDTNAVLKTVSVAMAKQRGGIIYFPESTGPCNVKTLDLPNSAGGWLYFLFDNSLLACTVHPGNYNAFVGRTGGFFGLSGAFGYGPTVDWQQGPSCSGPLVDLEAVGSVWFQGIDIETGYSDTDPAVHIHNIGYQNAGWVTFWNCVISQNGATNYRQALAVVADTDNPNVGGFGLRFEYSAIGGYPYSLSLTNFGMVEIRDSTLSEGGILLTNLGQNPGGDVLLDNILTENFYNTDVVDANSPGPINDIYMRDVRIADRVGTAYMFKHVGPTYSNVIFEDAPSYQEGDGFIDPGSSAHTIVATCIGATCGLADYAKPFLVKWSAIGLAGPDVFYMPGENPIQVLTQ